MSFKSIALMAGFVMAISAPAIGGAAAYAAPHKIATPGLVYQTAAVTPLSLQFFCAKNRSECASSSTTKVTMTPNLVAVLKQVNSQVNRAIRPRHDAADVWKLNPTHGDCEDYVISKRSALMRQGVSSGALRIAVTSTRWGEPHAVLIVRTSEGDYVLDNLTSSIKTLAASGYNIRSMSSSDPKKWVAG